MKVSEITNKELADYLKLEYTSLTEVEKSELDTLLEVAKSFIRSYTGINDEDVLNEKFGIGDGLTPTFYVDNIPVVPGSQTIYVDEVAKNIDVDYSFNATTGKTIFLNTFPVGEITADYKTGIDAYPDFVIVVYVLVQDMHDNRTLYVNTKNMNKVIETILGMHCTNLL